METFPKDNPLRKYWPIQYAGKVLGVNTSALRFWEGELHIKEVKRDKAGNRLYNENQMQLFSNMVRFQGFTRAQLINYITDLGG